MKKTINVVAAIIENEQNEILCALRSPQMSMPNLWEFPGGKVEKDEDIYTSITREIKEELACEVEPIRLFHENVHEYESIIVNIFAITTRIVDGLPVASEHAKLLWLKRENLCSLRWAPADIPAVEKLVGQSILKDFSTLQKSD